MHLLNTDATKAMMERACHLLVHANAYERFTIYEFSVLQNKVICRNSLSRVFWFCRIGVPLKFLREMHLHMTHNVEHTA